MAGVSVRRVGDSTGTGWDEHDDLIAVRSRIDQLDDELIRLLARRQVQVSRAALIKRDAAAVHAPARQAEVIARVRERSLAEGLDTDVAEQTWRAMIAGFVSLELREHEAAKGSSNDA